MDFMFFSFSTFFYVFFGKILRKFPFSVMRCAYTHPYIYAVSFEIAKFNLWSNYMKKPEETSIKILETDEPLDIRKDPVFKAVFTKETPASRAALSNLVSALISKNVTIVSILANEPPVENMRDRQLRFDINCRAENGELINVEMSFYPVAEEPVRLEFHAAKLFIGQDIKGSEKKYSDLNQTYQITIIGQECFFDDDTYFHTFEFYDPVNKISLNGRIQIITLELAKLEKVIEKAIDKMSISERWAVYFQYLTDLRKRSIINEILEKEEGIAMASQVLMTISKDEHERARIMSEEKFLLDMQSRMVNAKREGRTERDMEIARNALAEGLAVNVIQKITGLDVETIETL
jgi:predicted transposase/invertase (TIGR01784 family)